MSTFSSDDPLRRHAEDPDALDGPIRAVANRLRAERGRRGITLVEFGALGGVAKSTQASYERAERCPAADYLLRLQAAGVDVYYILTGESTPELGQRSFQGDLLEDILITIDRWALERAEQPSPEVKSQLARLFYEQFSTGTRVNQNHMLRMLKLVK